MCKQCKNILKYFADKIDSIDRSIDRRPFVLRVGITRAFIRCRVDGCVRACLVATVRDVGSFDWFDWFVCVWKQGVIVSFTSGVGCRVSGTREIERARIVIHASINHPSIRVIHPCICPKRTFGFFWVGAHKKCEHVCCFYRESF